MRDLGVLPGPSDHPSDTLLQAAETSAREALNGRPVEHLPHAAAWREAYTSFGAKPQRRRNSLEALLHQVPLGGEDLSSYVGAPRLVRAAGKESFDTVSRGAAVIEHPDPGEVVWCDDAGVTCRRWNWRQGRRTQLREDTTAALFILDALEPMTDEALDAAAEELAAHLARLGPDVRVARRLMAVGTTFEERD
jgi:DNA/RNA-binding domain of Phe-tRNA-synthetase-like protein